MRPEPWQESAPEGDAERGALGAESNDHGDDTRRDSQSRKRSGFSRRQRVDSNTLVTVPPTPQPVHDIPTDRLRLVHQIILTARKEMLDDAETEDRTDRRVQQACSAAAIMIQRTSRGIKEVVEHLMSVVGKGTFSAKGATTLAKQICAAATPRRTRDQVQEIARLFPTGTDDKMWMYITVLQKYTTQAWRQAQPTNPVSSLALPVQIPQQPYAH